MPVSVVWPYMVGRLKELTDDDLMEAMSPQEESRMGAKSLLDQLFKSTHGEGPEWEAMTAMLKSLADSAKRLRQK